MDHRANQNADDQFSERLAHQYSEFVQLVGGLAHEIKNPLSTIRLNMDLLAEDFSDAASARERRAAAKIDVVQRECQRLQNLLNDFLHFAKVRRLDLSPHDFNQEVTSVLDFYQTKAEAAGIDLVRYLDPNSATVMIHPETFHGALLNLLINAEQAMPQGGQLVVRTRGTASGVALDLIDTGCGMDSSTIRRAFDAFFSTKPGGSGLGLPTTQKLIDALGGTLSVKSESGRGTQFTIELATPPKLTAK